MSYKNTWVSTIDRTTAEFNSHFGQLSLEQLNWKPNAMTWSIAQNIDHLIVINSTYFPIFNSLQAGTYRAPLHGKIGFLVDFFGKTVLKAVQPDQKQKMKTFPIWEPASSEIALAILGKFEAHQQQLCAFIEACRTFVEKGTVIHSPANKVIVYTLATAFDIIVAHEQRHLEQAKVVLTLL